MHKNMHKDACWSNDCNGKKWNTIMLKNGEELDGMKYSDIRSSARQHRYPKYKNQMGKSTGNTVTL